MPGLRSVAVGWLDRAGPSAAGTVRATSLVGAAGRLERGPAQAGAAAQSAVGCRAARQSDGVTAAQ